MSSRLWIAVALGSVASFGACSSSSGSSATNHDAPLDGGSDAAGSFDALAPSNDDGSVADAAIDALAPPSDGGAQIIPDARAPDGSCDIRDIDYDQSCDADSQCARVQGGANVCTFEGLREGCLACGFGSVNVTAAATFNADLAAARAAFPDDGEREGFDDSCPMGDLIPVCINHQCGLTDDPDAAVRQAANLCN